MRNIEKIRNTIIGTAMLIGSASEVNAISQKSMDKARKPYDACRVELDDSNPVVTSWNKGQRSEYTHKGEYPVTCQVQGEDGTKVIAWKAGEPFSLGFGEDQYGNCEVPYSSDIDITVTNKNTGEVIATMHSDEPKDVLPVVDANGNPVRMEGDYTIGSRNEKGESAEVEVEDANCGPEATETPTPTATATETPTPTATATKAAETATPTATATTDPICVPYCEPVKTPTLTPTATKTEIATPTGTPPTGEEPGEEPATPTPTATVVVIGDGPNTPEPTATPEPQINRAYMPFVAR